MKNRQHRHKESFSILLISNTGQGSRQLHVSLFLFRLLIFLLLLIFVALGGLIYWFFSGNSDQTALLEQTVSQSQLILQLEEEKETLANENLALTAEIDALRQAEQVNEETEPQDTEETELPAEDNAETADPAVPTRYPCSGTGILTTTFSEEHPYLSINTQAEGNIIAAGDGTVIYVGSDNTYPLIIEIDHGNGYRTHYLFLQDAERKVEQGDTVHTGDVLTIISTNDTQLDYQIVHDDQPIDPLIIIDAEG